MDGTTPVRQFRQVWAETLIPASRGRTPSQILALRLVQDHDLTEADERDIRLAGAVAESVEKLFPAPQWFEVSRHTDVAGRQMFVVAAMMIAVEPLDSPAPRVNGQIALGDTLGDALLELELKLGGHG